MAIASQAISQMTTLVGSNSNDNCLFTLYNALISGSVNQNLKARISSHEQFYSNNNTVINQVNYNNYFGTGKDGSVTISSSAQISSSTSPAGLNNTLYGDTIVKNFQSLTINSGVLFSPLRPCRGLIIYCTGNLTVNGTISMTGKGGGVANKIAAPLGIASSTDSRYDLVDATLYFNNCSSSVAGGRGIPTHWNWAPSGSVWFNNYKMRIPLSGSVAGGAGGPGPNTAGSTGTAGVFCCGGGGGGAGGGGSPAPAGGAGGRATIFTGGAGGGGGSGPNGIAGANALYEVGGSGGPGVSNHQGAGGAGVPAGAATAPATNGGTGVGGLLILIVRGSVTINGTLSSNGVNGGNGSSGGLLGGGGGGSGGGRIMIIYGGTYTNAGTVVANGGSGGTGGPSSGGAGGAGSTTIRRVNI